MKHFRSLLLLLAFVAASTMPAHAGWFRIGPRAGLMINKVDFKDLKYDISTDNRLGWQVGAQMNFELPIVGLGFDISPMYTRFDDKIADDQLVDQVTFHRDYLDLPVHLHYAFSILGVERFVKPYLFTGADFSFRLSDVKDLKFQTKSTRVLWDIGLGVELIRHIQVSATYSLGLTDAFGKVGLKDQAESALSKYQLTDGEGSARDNTWTISVAYLF